MAQKGQKQAVRFKNPAKNAPHKKSNELVVFLCKRAKTGRFEQKAISPTKKKVKMGFFLFKIALQWAKAGFLGMVWQK